jgi:DNA mismatch repair ATPase MutS
MLLQVMAQVGCYVPADSALFRPMSRMFARIYLEDNMEYGASSFILEVNRFGAMKLSKLVFSR